MRWFVEVSRVGEGSSAERYCLEAKAWQAALQEARKLRGDAGPLSKFSIELLDDGYRAVDPVQKVRYVVNQAPADAALSVPPTNGSSLAPPGVSGAAPRLVVSSPPPAIPSAPPPASPASAPPAGGEPPAPTTSAPPVAVAAASAPPVAAAAASAPPAAAASAPPAAAAAASAPKAAAPSTESAKAPPASAPPPAASSPSAPPTGALKPSRPVVISAPPAAIVTAAPPAAASEPPLQTAKAPASSAPKAASSAQSNTATPLSPVVKSAPPAGAPSERAQPQIQRPSTAAAQAPSLRPGPSDAPRVGAAQVAARATASSSFELAATPPEHRVLTSRLEAPSPETPITYREEVYVVEPGTTKLAVETLLVERFERIRAELASSPAGQFVRLAVFDVAFEGRPPHLPLGTLAWKDWRGSPQLGFPFFGEAAPPMGASLPPRPDTSAEAVVAPPDPPPAPKPALAAPEKASDSEPAPSGPKASAARRAASEDLISELFERLSELMFADSVVAAASFVLEVVSDVIPTELALVHVYDLNTRNFVVVRARGAGLERALLENTPDSDALLAEVLRGSKALARSTRGDEQFERGRWRFAASPVEQVLCGAARRGGRYFGIIELANPAGGAPFGENEINALDYACEQFAEFVATHPVVLDRDVVLGA